MSASPSTLRKELERAVTRVATGEATAVDALKEAAEIVNDEWQFEVILDSIINASMCWSFSAPALPCSVGVGCGYASFPRLSGDKKILSP